MMIHRWFNTLKSLSCVQRYSKAQLTMPENVMEHSGQVALMCLHIAYNLKQEQTDFDKDWPYIQTETLLINALIHDIDESETGDVQRPTKYHSDKMRAAFAEMEKVVAKGVLQDADMPKLIVNWEKQKLGTEGAILAFADAASVLIKTHDEIVMRGNRTMFNVIQSLEFVHCFRMLRALKNIFPDSNFLEWYHNDLEDMVREIRDARIV